MGRSGRRDWLVWVLLGGVMVGCPPGGGEDDGGSPTPTPGEGTPTGGGSGSPTEEPSPPSTGVYTEPPGETDPPTGTPTPPPATPYHGPLTVEGRVIAVDAATFEELSDEEYTQRSGTLAVYLVQDPEDLRNIEGKATLVLPGPYSITVERDQPTLSAVAVADWNLDKFLAVADVVAEYAHNPLNQNLARIEGVDILLPVPSHGSGGGGGGGGAEYVAFSGEVQVSGEVPDVPLAVTSNDANFYGPYTGVTLDEPGPFSELYVYRDLGTTNLLGYADVDLNGLFEPSDAVGEADANPYDTSADVSGVLITIDDVPPLIPIPLPPTYIDIDGSVSYDDYTSGKIKVYATQNSVGGFVYSAAVLNRPGAFHLRVPSYSPTVVWALLDEDNDGEPDEGEPFARVGPLAIGTSDVPDVDLELHPYVEPTPAPEPTPGEATPTLAPTELPTPEATPAATPAASTPEAPSEAPTPAPTPTPTAAPTPTATPGQEASPPPTATLPPGTPTPPLGNGGTGSLTGTLHLKGSCSAGDRLVIGVFTRMPNGSIPPEMEQNIPLTSCTFPREYLFPNVAADTYYIAGYLDVGGNNESGPGAEDIQGAYSTTGGGPSPIVLAEGQEKTGLDVYLGGK